MICLQLAPAYDLISTLPYLNNRELALNFSKQKKFYAINKESLIYFAKCTQIPEALILNTAKETVANFHATWRQCIKNEILEKALKEHLTRLPLASM